MKAFSFKIIHKPWFFPLVLLFLGVIAYGLIMPRLGFYWDDWEGVYLYKLHNPAISFMYYNERPLSAIPYLLLFPIVKMTPIAWEITSLLLRWGGVLFLYFTFNLVWPLRIQQNRWIAALLFIFPGFLEQPVSVAFTQHLGTFLFFACSLFLTVLALKQRRYFWLWMPLSILLGSLQIFMMEYFVGLEIIRPILIWFLLHSEEKQKGCFWKTLMYWSPFVLILAVYLYWRLIYLPPTLGMDPNNPVLLKTLLASPISGLSTLFTMIYQDILQLLLYVWPKAFLNLDIMDISSKRVWFSWLCGALAGFGFYLYNHFNRNDEKSNDRSSAQLIFIGLVLLLFGAAPVWATGKQIAVGKWSERFALAPMLGAVILVVNTIEWLFRTRKQKQILLTVLLGISISGQVTNQFIFRDDWVAQKNIYWQLHWRIPSLQPGTALFGRGTFTDKSSYYDGSYILNLIFDDPVHQNMRFAYFDIYHNGPDDYFPGIPLTQTPRGTQFSGNTSQALVFDFGVRGGCVKVLDTIYKDDPDLSSSVADLIDISDVTNISPTPDVPLNSDIFGSEPAHSWCYYFEKADLARQMQDWVTILQLKTKIDALDLTPDLASEYFPFIEAYAQTGQWEQAYQLSETTHGIGSGAGTALCNVWQRFTQFNSTAEMLSFTGKAKTEFCSTGNQ